MSFRRRIKQLFCKHDYAPWANIFGDFIHVFDGARTVLICRKCGKRKYIKEFINAPLNYNCMFDYIVLTSEGTEKACKLAESYKEDIFRDKELYVRLFCKGEEEEVDRDSRT